MYTGQWSDTGPHVVLVILSFIKLADNQHMYKISDEFESEPVQILLLQSYSPLNAKINVV